MYTAVTFSTDQLNVAFSPALMVVLFAVKVISGAGVGVGVRVAAGVGVGDADTGTLGVNDG